MILSIYLIGAVIVLSGHFILFKPKGGDKIFTALAYIWASVLWPALLVIAISLGLFCVRNQSYEKS